MASNVMNFIDSLSAMGQERKPGSIAIQQDIEDSILKTCEKAELPEYASNNTLIYTRDSGEMYAGRGKGLPLLNMSDVIIINNFDYLPLVGVSNKLYISKKDGIFAYYDESISSYKYLKLNETQEEVISKSGILEFNRVNDFPLVGEPEKLYLTRDNLLYRWDVLSAKYTLISNQGAFEKILKVINTLGDYELILNQLGDLQKFKANKEDLANYRQTKDKIKLADLGEDAIEYIDSGGAAFKEDCDQLKKEISELKSSKADKEDLSKYRLSTVSIKESDLDIDAQSKLNYTYNDTELRSAIDSLNSSKLDTVTANDTFRNKETLIDEVDLTPDLINKLGYDDTVVNNKIANLETSKADKADVEQSITSVNESIALKADASVLANYRKISVSIGENDLSNKLKAKIDSIPPEYNDSGLKQTIQDLEDKKADKAELASYRKIDESIVLNDLGEELKNLIDDKINTDTFNDYKTAVETNLNNYRLTSTKITEDDLDSDTKTKLNYTYNDSEIRQDIQNLESSKADKKDLDSYRKTDEPIIINDLGEELKNTINNKVDTEDFNMVRSCYSGDTFPTVNLIIGMLCYRTDEEKLYVLDQIEPTTIWNTVVDTDVINNAISKVNKSIEETNKTIEVTNEALESHKDDPQAHELIINEIRAIVANSGLNLLRRNTQYAVGDIAYSSRLPSWARLECVQAGTTDTDEPDFTQVSAGGGTNP